MGSEKKVFTVNTKKYIIDSYTQDEINDITIFNTHTNDGKKYSLRFRGYEDVNIHYIYRTLLDPIQKCPKYIICSHIIVSYDENKTEYKFLKNFLKNPDYSPKYITLYVVPDEIQHLTDLVKNKSLTYEMLLKLIVDIGSAIIFIHNLNICHRRINEKNIYFNNNEFILDGFESSCSLDHCNKYYSQNYSSTPFIKNFDMFYENKQNVDIKYCYTLDIHFFMILITNLLKEIKNDISQTDYNNIDEIINSYVKIVSLNIKNLENLTDQINGAYLFNIIKNIVKIYKARNKTSTSSSPSHSPSPSSLFKKAAELTTFGKTLELLEKDIENRSINIESFNKLEKLSKNVTNVDLLSRFLNLKSIYRKFAYFNELLSRDNINEIDLEELIYIYDQLENFLTTDTIEKFQRIKENHETDIISGDKYEKYFDLKWDIKNENDFEEYYNNLNLENMIFTQSTDQFYDVFEYYHTNGVFIKRYLNFPDYIDNYINELLILKTLNNGKCGRHIDCIITYGSKELYNYIIYKYNEDEQFFDIKNYNISTDIDDTGSLKYFIFNFLTFLDEIHIKKIYHLNINEYNIEYIPENSFKLKNFEKSCFDEINKDCILSKHDDDIYQIFIYYYDGVCAEKKSSQYLDLYKKYDVFCFMFMIYKLISGNHPFYDIDHKYQTLNDDTSVNIILNDYFTKFTNCEEMIININENILVL